MPRSNRFGMCQRRSCVRLTIPQRTPALVQWAAEFGLKTGATVKIAARPPSDQRVAHIANGARHSEADERRGTCQDRFASTLRWRGLASCELPKVNPCTPQPVRPCRRCRSDHHWTRLASIASLASSHTRLWDHSKIAVPGVEHLKAKVNSK